MWLLTGALLLLAPATVRGQAPERIPARADLDLAWEQFGTDISGSLRIVDEALAHSEPGVGSAYLHLVRARLRRLRAEYRAAELELAAAESMIDSDMFHTRQEIWAERMLITQDLMRSHGMGFPPNADLLLERQKLRFELLLEVYDLLVARLRAYQGPLEVWEGMPVTEQMRAEVRNLEAFFEDHTETMRLVGALEEPPSPSSLDRFVTDTADLFVTTMHDQFDGQPAVLGPEPRVPRVLTTGQRWELISWRPELIGAELECEAVDDPRIALSCAEQLLVQRDPLTLGLGPSKEAHRDLPSLIGEYLREGRERRERAQPLLVIASADRRHGPTARARLRVTHLRILARLLPGLVDHSVEFGELYLSLEQLQHEVSALGDRKLQLELAAHTALVAALMHDREGSLAHLAPALAHIEAEDDALWAHAVAETFATVARLQPRFRSDMIAAEILLDGAIALWQAADGQLQAAMALAELGRTYRIAGAYLRARDALRRGRLLLSEIEPGVLPWINEYVGVLLTLEQRDLAVEQFDQPGLVQAGNELLRLQQGCSDEGPLSIPDAFTRERIAAVEFEADFNEFVAFQSAMVELTHMNAEQRFLSMSSTSFDVHELADIIDEMKARLAPSWDLLPGYFAAIGAKGTTEMCRRLAELDADLRFDVAMLTEDLALLHDPDRPANARAQRFTRSFATLQVQRSEVYATLLAAAGQREAAIDLLAHAPDWGELVPETDVLIGGVVPFEQPDDHVGERFMALVELGAMREAGVLLDVMQEHPDDDSWAFQLSPAWDAYAAWIRWSLEVHGPEVAWARCGRLLDALGDVDRIADPRLRQGTTARLSFVEAIGAAIDVALARGDTNAAANLILRSQPSLFDQLIRPELDHDGEVERDDERRRVADLASMQNLLLGKVGEPGCDAGCRVQLEDRAEDLQREFEQHLGEPLGVDRTLPVERVQLTPGTALLTHFSSKSATLLLLLRPGQAPLVVRRESEYLRLRGRVQRVGSLLGRGVQEPTLDADLAELARVLLPDPALLQHTERLIVIPSDVIADVPFALLPWGDGLLLDRHDISQLPSLSLLTLPSTRAAPRSRPHARVLVAEAGAPLQFAVRESKAVRPGGAREVTRRATRADFNAAITDPEVDLVHVIAHGHAATPNRSAELLLTPTTDDEGRIRAEDILLETKAVAPRWMVFSTCEVGMSRGSLVDDGFLVGNALLLHGLDEAVVPLWQVEDSKNTVEFWREFYRALRRHGSLAKALNEAQRKARARGLPISVWGAYKVLSRTP